MKLVTYALILMAMTLIVHVFSALTGERPVDIYTTLTFAYVLYLTYDKITKGSD